MTHITQMLDSHPRLCLPVAMRKSPLVAIRKSPPLS